MYINIYFIVSCFIYLNIFMCRRVFLKKKVSLHFYKQQFHISHSSNKTLKLKQKKNHGNKTFEREFVIFLK